MTQPNPETVQVPQQRATEIFQGKAATTIKDLMVENSQLSAIAEQLGKELQAERSAHRETRAKLGAAMGAEGNHSAPPPPIPRDGIDASQGVPGT